MLRFVSVSVTSGLLFGAMDGFLNANPLARELYSFWKPVARESLNVPAGLVLDVAWGFAMTAVYLILRQGLPGSIPLYKGLSYGILLWLLRVVTSAASQWMMFQVPTPALLYSLGAGFFEMMILSMLIALLLKPGEE